eukprot:3934086-Prymnesium_polylepis.1
MLLGPAEFYRRGRGMQQSGFLPQHNQLVAAPLSEPTQEPRVAAAAASSSLQEAYGDSGAAALSAMVQRLRSGAAHDSGGAPPEPHV